MLVALLLGFVFHFASKDEVFAAGVSVTAKRILRIGVALLGMRITFDQILGVGLDGIFWVGQAVLLTILFGFLAAKVLGISEEFGLLSGGAVAICGASAALAISCVLPDREQAERNTAVVIIVVTASSTMAMIAYPLLAVMLGLNDAAAGMFLGGSIHDVAQVVGAGYGMSPDIGDIAIVTKMSRVAMLAPIVLLLIWAYPCQRHQKAPMPFPVFLVFFCMFVVIGSANIIPDGLKLTLVDVSGYCLTAAIAGLGMKTSMKSLAGIGIIPIGLILMETLVLGLSVLLGVSILK